MTLEEIIKNYKWLGLSDMDVIRYYIKVNHMEDQAVELLTDVCRSTITDLTYRNGALKEAVTYTTTVLYNDGISFEDKRALALLYTQWLSAGELSKEGLNRAKDILSKYTKKELTTMPMCFLGYLQRCGVGLEFSDCRNSKNIWLEKEHNELESKPDEENTDSVE